MKNDIESIAQRVLNIYPVKRAGLVFGNIKVPRMAV